MTALALAPVRWYRPAMLGLALVILLFAAAIWQVRWIAAGPAVGIDYRTWVDFGTSWLAGDLYRPYQLAGPYAVHDPALIAQPSTVPNLYPPPFGLVAVALTVLPWPVWWAVPIGILGWCVASWRPAPWTWPLMAAVLAWPATSSVVIVGGTTMWAVALVALGLRFRWPAALVLLKPTLLPFALVGVRHRGWWILAAILVLVSLPLAPDYIAAMRNARDANLWYSLGDLPLLMAPVVAWHART